MNLPTHNGQKSASTKNKRERVPAGAFLIRIIHLATIDVWMLQPAIPTKALTRPFDAFAGTLHISGGMGQRVGFASHQYNVFWV